MSAQDPLFILLAKLAEKDGVAPINRHTGCWERQIGEHWWIAVNGHKDKISCSKGPEVEPFHCYVEFNGWPAGIFNPMNGIIACGYAANEDAFAAAIETELSE